MAIERVLRTSSASNTSRSLHRALRRARCSASRLKRLAHLRPELNLLAFGNHPDLESWLTLEEKYLRAQLSLVDTANRVNFLTGTPLQALLDTSEHQADGGRRSRIRGFRPDTDAATCFGSVGARENIQTLPTYSAEQAVNGKGLCPANVSTRLARGRLRIPAGTSWTFATGIEPFFSREGVR